MDFDDLHHIPEHWSFSPVGLASPCSGQWTLTAFLHHLPEHWSFSPVGLASPCSGQWTLTAFLHHLPEHWSFHQLVLLHQFWAMDFDIFTKLLWQSPACFRPWILSDYTTVNSWTFFTSLCPSPICGQYVCMTLCHLVCGCILGVGGGWTSMVSSLVPGCSGIAWALLLPPPPPWTGPQHISAPMHLTFLHNIETVCVCVCVCVCACIVYTCMCMCLLVCGYIHIGALHGLQWFLHQYIIYTRVPKYNLGFAVSPPGLDSSRLSSPVPGCPGITWALLLLPLDWTPADFLHQYQGVQV